MSAGARCGWSALRTAIPGSIPWLEHAHSRRAVEARFGVRGLLRHRVRGIRGRGMGGRLQQRDPASARRAFLPAPRPHRSVAARMAQRLYSRALHRLRAGRAALVGPLPQGSRHRDRGRADVPGVDAGGVPPKPPVHRASGGAGWRKRSGLLFASRVAASLSMPAALPCKRGMSGSSSTVRRSGSASMRASGVHTGTRRRCRWISVSRTASRCASIPPRSPRRSRSSARRQWSSI